MAIEDTPHDTAAAEGGIQGDLRELAGLLGLSGNFFRLNRREAVLLVRYAAGRFVLGWVDAIRWYKYLAFPLAGLALFFEQPLLAGFCLLLFLLEAGLENLIRRLARRVGGFRRLGRFDAALTEMVDSVQEQIGRIRPWRILRSSIKASEDEAEDVVVRRLLGIDLDLHTRRLLEARAALAEAALRT